MTVARVFLAWAAAAAMGCLPGSKSIGSNDEDAGNDDAGDADDDDDDDDSATSAGDGDDGMKLDLGGTSGDDDDDDDDDVKLDVGAGTTGGSECIEPDLCEPCAPGCVPDNSCVGGEWVCDCVCGDSGGEPVCDMEETACEVAEMSKLPPIDCGVATLDDDVSVWEDVHACVDEQSTMGGAFKSVFYIQGIDSSPRVAYLGQVGFVYALSRLSQDVGGVAGPDSPIYQTQCSELEVDPECEIIVGASPCITCTTTGDPFPVCEP